MATKDEKKHFDKIAQLGCILCRTAFGIKDSPAELHHIRRFGGKRATSPIIPLCPEHHRGNSGVHGLGAKGFENEWGITQEALLQKVKELLGE
jgi:Recombination enhancement, RecA-dependent nuclease